MPRQTAPKFIGTAWNFASVWNKTLDNIEDRPLIKRDYIWASELGGAFCDRYLKMNGVAYSNPPNNRSKRKFQAGNMWEWVVGMVLTSAGLLKQKQIRVESKFPKLLKVSGKLDYVVGGDIDWKAAKNKIQTIKESLFGLDIDLPPFFFAAIDKFIDEYSGKKLKEVVQEMKSVSSFMMEKIQKTGEPMPHHVLQIFHYIYGNDVGIDEGKITYVCKDDCIMEEFEIYNNEQLLAAYKDDIRKMTAYYNKGFDPKNPFELMPPKESMILFEEGVWRFAKNFNVEYSPYLELLYKYQSPEAYRMAWQYKISSWNRVFKRCVKGNNMTEKNNEVIADAKKHFPKWDSLVAAAKKAGAFQDNEEQEED